MEQEPSLIERLARHLAAGFPEDWPDRIADAASLLALLKQPDAAMRAAGDERQWRTMIDAALAERWNLPQALQSTPQDIAPGGSDEEGDMELDPSSQRIGRSASWVHTQ